MLSVEPAVPKLGVTGQSAGAAEKGRRGERRFCFSGHRDFESCIGTIATEFSNELGGLHISTWRAEQQEDRLGTVS